MYYLDKLKLDIRNDFRKIKIGNYTVSSLCYIDEDWNYYSKAWHRRHGPKRTVSDRTLLIERKCGRGTRKWVTDLKTFGGDFVARAVVKHGLEPKRSKYSLKYRLNKAFDCKKIKRKRGYIFYKRILLNETIGFIVEAKCGTLYHLNKKHESDELNEREMIKLVNDKLKKSKLKKTNKLINYKLCRSLGFCEAGIKSFCDDFGFSLKDELSAKELFNKLDTKSKQVSAYLRELKSLAKAVNFDWGKK